MLEIKSVMAMLCQNFSFTRKTVPEVEEKFAFVMTPVNLLVQLRRRNEA